MAEKPKLSMYWAAACGGCEVALVNINEKILDVDANFDFMFCPCLLDTKKKDIEALPDGAILITLFNGALRTEENKEMAHLLRKKSKLLISFGSCASEGCIPALGNLAPSDTRFKLIYQDTPSSDNKKGVFPQAETKVPEGKLTLPVFLSRVKALHEEVEVDYSIPGCPPEPHQIWNVIEYVLSGKPLPPKGSILGAGKSTVCNECTRIKNNKKIKKFKRTFEFIPDREECLLEQGLICMGIATRDGCGGLCPKVNMPCTGCYGPSDGVEDQGAKMIAALGSAVDIDDIKTMSEIDINKRLDEMIKDIPDIAGTFYRYSLSGSLVKGRISS